MTTLLLITLLLLPLAGFLWVLPRRRYQPSMGPVTAVLAGLDFAAALLLAWRYTREGPVTLGPGEFLRIDALSAILVLAVTFVAWISLWVGSGSMHRSWKAKKLDELSLRRYYLLVNLFLFTMLLALSANNVGLMWAAVEATTIATAFLIGLQQNKPSLEASWKYILIGSVGIAMAFVGTVLAYFNFVQRAGPMAFALHWTVLAGIAGRLNADILKLAFVFLLIGYGTKAGLAPMHTWLPDAHAEAPAPISSLMSGALLVVALYALLRWKAVVDACTGTEFTDRLLLILGLLSLAVAALMLLRQTSYKRLLAYSSVEHMGLMCLGLGFGPPGIVAALFHVLAHGAGKSMLFLLSGEILEAYGSPRIAAVRGLMRSMRRTGMLFAAGILALLGFPPFGTFLSKFLLLQAGFQTGHLWVTSLTLFLMVVVFAAFLGHANRMLYGTPPADLHAMPPPTVWTPLWINLGVLLLLGLYPPPALLQLITQAVQTVHR